MRWLQRFLHWVHSAVQDWRYAWRGLRRSPGLTVVAVGSLALGIGANAAIFGIIHSLLLARLPVPASAELIQVVRDLGAKGADERFSADEFAALTSGPLHLTMYSSTFATAEIERIAANVSVDAVDGTYFGVLRVPAARGRVISPDDATAAAPVAVVTDKFWRGRLDRDPAVLGRVIGIDGHPFTIIGVTPAGFAGLGFPAVADVMIPYRAATTLGMIRSARPRLPMVTVVGRRAVGQSIVDAQNELGVVWNHCCAAGELVTPFPGQAAAPSTLRVADVSRGIPQQKLDLRGRYARILLALMAGVAVLLLAACANVASLLLARSSARVGEFAVRLALGASRTRLMMQLAIESLQLAALGAIAGAALARWGTAVLIRAKVGDLAGVVSPTLGPAVLEFTAAVSLVAVLIFGVVPAIRVMRTDLVTPLSQSGRRSARARQGVLDRGLIALQMALALLLVSGAMLLVATLRNLQTENLGFEPSQRLVLSAETRKTAYARQGMTARMANEMLRRVRAIPGVGDAGLGSIAPIYGGRGSYDNVSVRGGSAPATAIQTDFAGVTPGYFAALGIARLEGSDVPQPVSQSGIPATRDVVVNEAFAKRFFPDRDAIGRVFEDADDGDSLATHDRIVGIVADARYQSPRAPARPMFFVPVADGDWPFLILIVRAAGSADAVARAMPHTISDVAPGIGAGGAERLSDAIDDALIRERIAATLATLFGAVALLLVAVGLYGVMLYQVTMRTPELGIRMALGADARSIVSLVLGQSLAIVGIGALAGIPLAVLAGRAVASQLYGVAPYSPMALAIATASLVVVASAASLVPVRRAVTIDPLTALRAE